MLFCNNTKPIVHICEDTSNIIYKQFNISTEFLMKFIIVFLTYLGTKFVIPRLTVNIKVLKVEHMESRQ